MDNCCKRAWLPVLSMVMILIQIPGNVSAQFEQKLSLNISGGYFNTVGWNGWEEGWEEHGPSLMPNFKGGPSLIAGLQYNFSRHFSIEFQLGYRLSFSWYFDASPESEDPFNYLYWEIEDESGNGVVIESGENYMDLSNLHLGIAPRYYLFPGKRFNPFIYAGISLNYTDVWFDNTEYEAYESLGRPDDYPQNEELINWFEWSVGVGFMAGAGVEFVLNETLGLFANAGYHFIRLNEDAFYENTYLVNYHDISINLGVRISILKSKEL